ncbi:MAG: hypothetical protein ACWGMT_06760, partial [Burkholderiales bacterium]
WSFQASFDLIALVQITPRKRWRWPSERRPGTVSPVDKGATTGGATRTAPNCPRLAEAPPMRQ